MNVNGVTKVNEAYQAYQKTEAVKDDTETVAKEADKNPAAETGVIYEPTLEMPTQTYKANSELIAKLKADTQARLDQLQNLVTQLITKQAGAFSNANDIWSILREGKFEVDPETKAQAQKDIAEDGYWGVTQTSDRIIDFAKALTGGDPSKMSKMLDAFKKGYEKAEKTWGGELPEISKKTYDRVLEKFDELINGTEKTTVTE